MTKEEFIKRCEKLKSTIGSEGTLLTPEDAALESIATEQNEFFTPSNLAFSKTAIKSILLSEESLDAFINETEKVYGISFEKVRESNRGIRIGIIMAGNIPGVGFADLFCTLSLGFTAVVKFSSKDSYFMWELTQKLLQSFPEFCVETPDYILEDKLKENLGGVIFAGSNESKSQITSKLKDIPLLCRGSRFSFGVILPNSKLTKRRAKSSDFLSIIFDALLYFGLGCRSLTYLFVPKGFNWSPFFDYLNRINPLLDIEAWRNSLTRERAVAQLNGTKIYKYDKMQGEFSINDDREYIIDSQDIILHKTRDTFPPLGVINFWEYDPQDENPFAVVEEFEQIHKEQIQKKYTNFGSAQLPLLTDWQDGVSTIEFLSKCTKYRY